MPGAADADPTVNAEVCCPKRVVASASCAAAANRSDFINELGLGGSELDVTTPQSSPPIAHRPSPIAHRMSLLDREHSIAEEGFSRWLVPPAALAIHLSIGQAYAFSVFNLPLSRLIGGTESAPADWKLSTIGWVFSTAIVFLGLSAAVFGRWVERVGPRRAMFASACSFGSGFLVAAAGVTLHQFALVLLGYGVLGGIRLG